MDMNQVKTFLAVVANGSFLEAAKRLHITQSTVSNRIQGLEEYLGATLFIRNRSGAALTPAGRRFIHHAKAFTLTLDQARHDVGLPSRYRASITIGARIALWEVFLPRWVGEIRRSSPDISIRSEIGFEEELMRRVIEGTMDVALRGIALAWLFHVFHRSVKWWDGDFRDDFLKLLYLHGDFTSRHFY